MPELWRSDTIKIMSVNALLGQELKDENLHKLMLKKIKIEVRTGQAVLQISDKHNQVTELIKTHNSLQKVNSFADVNKQKKSYTYVIADLDNPSLDDLDKFLDEVASMIIRPGLLIIIATNLCDMKGSLQLLFGHAPEHFSRPCRAVPPGYLRNKLLEKGYFVKNRYWQYDKKLLIMADIPNKY